MAYAKSVALEKWFGPRAESIARIAKAHIDLGEVEGPGRPLELGRPLAHAYVIRVVAEFQGFVRDLYDLSCEHLVTVAAPPDGLVAMLTTAMTRGRALDAGNATMAALRTDFGRLGVRNLEGKLAARYRNWDRQSGGSDPKRYDALIRVRNALAHGNQHQITELRRQASVTRQRERGNSCRSSTGLHEDSIGSCGTTSHTGPGISRGDTQDERVAGR